MSFNPVAGLAVAELVRLLPADPSVVELGNQTLACRKALDEVIRLCPGASEAALRQATLTSEFYLAIGFRDYTAIDVNSEFGSLVMDLNEDLRASYGYTRQFDLVTNNGTGEHIFDQRRVLENMHHLCRPGGLMLHIMPFHRWLNHGMYNFQPKLYLDLAYANEYQVERLALAERNGSRIDLDLADAAKTCNPGKQVTSLTRALEKLEKRGPVNVQVVAVLRRKNEQPFRVPLDGRYLTALEGEDLHARYHAPE